MKSYFDKSIVDKAILYAKKKLPEEMCGFIVDNDFIPVDNIADDKTKSFKINIKDYIKYNDRIQCIMHSHDNYPHLSKEDVENQIRSNIPWGVVFLKNKMVDNVVFYGDSLEIQDLIERPFIYGVYDCANLMRDYYRLNGINLKRIIPTNYLWWLNEDSYFEKYYEEFGFYVIDKSELRDGDMVLFQIQSNVINHCGIYLNNGILLHHLAGKLSCKEPLFIWKDYIIKCLRYKNA